MSKSGDKIKITRIVLCSRIFRVDWFGKISNNLNLLSREMVAKVKKTKSSESWRKNGENQVCRLSTLTPSSEQQRSWWTEHFCGRRPSLHLQNEEKKTFNFQKCQLRCLKQSRKDANKWAKSKLMSLASPSKNNSSRHLQQVIGRFIR